MKESETEEIPKIGANRYTVSWKKNQINTSCKVLLDNIKLAKEAASFLTSNRMKEMLTYGKRQKINWEVTKRCIQGQDTGCTGTPSFKESKKRQFNIKKIANELPTLEVLKKRDPMGWGTQTKCLRCEQEEETVDHVWTCGANKLSLQGYKETLKRHICKIAQNKGAKRADGIQEHWDLLMRSETATKGREVNIQWGDTARGIIPQQWIENLIINGLSEARAMETIEEAWEQGNEIIEKIWKQRSIEFKKWSIQLGLGKKKKTKEKLKEKKRQEKEKKNLEKRDGKGKEKGKEEGEEHKLDREKKEIVQNWLAQNREMVVTKRSVSRLYSSWGGLSGP